MIAGRALPVLLFLLTAAAPALAGDCDLMTAAWVRQLYLPRHITQVATLNGKTLSVESIWLDAKFYIRPSDKTVWTIVDQPADAAEATYRKAAADGGETCQAEPSEVVGGAVFDVVFTHRMGHQGPFDTRTWISRATGLPTRSESDMESGGHVSTTIGYDNIAAPANAVPPSDARANPP